MKLSGRKPHKYQQRGVEWLLGHGGAGLFADPGTGKTGITLRALLALKDSGVSERTLVIAPLRVAHEVWPVEPEEWINGPWDRVRELKIVVLHGSKKDLLLEQDADIFVINFEGLKWLMEGNRFKKLGCDTLVVDESSKLRHTRTKRFKMLKPVLSTFARRWILTGSPSPKSYMDLFGQIYLLDLGRALGKYITHFRFEYFIPLDQLGWEWRLKEDSEKRIQKAVAPYIFRLDAKDYLDLPEEIPNIIRVDLPPAARKVYKELEDELITQLEDRKVVTAASQGAVAIKCAQVANGGLFHMAEDTNAFTGKRTWADLHTAKIEATLELIEELQGSPCLVVYDFKHDLSRLQTALRHEFGEGGFKGDLVPYIGGGVGAKESAALIARWNRDELPVLLVHPQTVSHGLNLQKGTARHIIWHSLTYDRELYDQLNRRLIRQGSRQDRVFIHSIVARDTIDEAKLTALRRKGKSQQNFLDSLKEYIKRKK